MVRCSRPSAGPGPAGPRQAARDSDVWTVDEPGAVRTMTDLGVDGIITDCPGPSPGGDRARGSRCFDTHRPGPLTVSTAQSHAAPGNPVIQADQESGTR
ncbi:hypothetical protein [Streptomyces sp. NPDC048392]|uniref:hypothetical protein n=1 Tax=Streptomyces sp. NPDC048392 TaxID=3365543 RepID=UPI0037164405